MKWKQITVLAVLTTSCLLAEAKVKPIVHYNFGNQGMSPMLWLRSGWNR